MAAAVPDWTVIPSMQHTILVRFGEAERVKAGEPVGV
jgi:hypothetical protein